MFAKIFTTKVNTENYENENIEAENYEVTVYFCYTFVKLEYSYMEEKCEKYGKYI